MTGSGRESIPESRVWSGGPTGGPDWSGDSPGRPELVGRPSLSGREAHPEDMEALLEGREVLQVGREVLPEGLEPFWRAGSGREAFLEGRERS